MTVIIALSPYGRSGMKRDMELVREILLKVQARTDLKPQRQIIEGRDDLIVERHIEMLYEAGLLEGLPHKSSQRPAAGAEIFITDMSWEGHDFLAALENENVWSKIRTTFSTAELAGLPVSLLKELGAELLKVWAKGKLGLE